VKKNQTRVTGMDNQILSLYAKGMTTREIAAAFKELYDANVSLALVSKVTDAVMDLVPNGKIVHCMQSIPLFILTVSS
jgi:putative transposase